MAIFPAKYNGINFSYDFTRESNLFNFDNQRRKNVLPVADFKYISFLVIGSNSEAYVKLKIHDQYSGVEEISPLVSMSLGTADNRWIYYFGDFSDFLPGNNKYIYFSFQKDNEIIYSEIYTLKSDSYIHDNEICKITAYNNDARHGYLTYAYPAFGFFKFSKLNSDIFINKKTEYEYSYGRRKILSSENNIGRRLTFLDLTMYQQNLLKWLCNTENLFIDGIRYELISDFTELLSDENSEIKDLRADFVEAEQSFFATGSNLVPKNTSPKEFYLLGANSLTIAGGVSGVGGTEGGETPGTSDHTQLINKNGELTFQHVDTTITKENLDAGDKVSILDVNTGKMVMVDKDKLAGTIPQEIIDLIYAGL